MTEAFKVLYQGQVPSSATVLYTVPASTSTIVRYAVAVNTDATIVWTIRLWVGGVANSNIWLPSLPLEPGDRAEFEGVLTLEAGQTIRGISGQVNTVTLMITGLEVT